MRYVRKCSILLSLSVPAELASLRLARRAPGEPHSLNNFQISASTTHSHHTNTHLLDHIPAYFLWFSLALYKSFERKSKRTAKMKMLRPAPLLLAMVFGLASGKENSKDKNPSPTPSPVADEAKDMGPVFNTYAESREWVGGKFCVEPNDKGYLDQVYCKQKTDYWKELVEAPGTDITFHQRDMSGECGPDCRPSCITLMLDLDKFDYATDLTCQTDQLCQCEFEKCSDDCTQQQKDLLFEEHPKCYLEHADCLGATVYDDTATFVEQMLESGTAPSLDKCSCIPDNELYYRFQDWKMIKPIKEFTCTHNCVNKDRKIYWEYCNIIEEDTKCDQEDTKNECVDNKCGKNCNRVTEPFPPGFTTFTVSASIPYSTGVNDKCDEELEYEDATDTACFLQRIDIYYPADDDDCSIGCPHCHDCPMISLGDKFGPLEVVGFGHSVDDYKNWKNEHVCAACDRMDMKYFERDFTLDCEDLFSCHMSVDCYTGDSLELPSFRRDCTFCDDGEAPATQTSSSKSAAYDESNKPLIAMSTVPIFASAAIGAACYFLGRRRGRKTQTTAEA